MADDPWSARGAPHHFDRALAVLQDQLRVPPDPQMIGFILLNGGADLEISRRDFRIRFAWNPSRHKYFLDLAPGVLSGLLDWCQLPFVTQPTLARLASRLVPSRCAARVRGTLIDHHVWLLPGDPIRVMLRPVVTGLEDQTIDRLPKTIAHERRWVHLTASQLCPWCLAAASRFRKLGDAWLCSACARSFNPDECMASLVGETVVD